MERLARLVEPDPLVRPPESIVRPISITCDGERKGGGREGVGRIGVQSRRGRETRKKR